MIDVSVSVAGILGVVLAYRLGDRLIALREREEAQREADGKGRVTGKMPDDIAALASQYHDEWARDSFLARAQELYEKTTDWGQVRLLLEDSVQ